MRKNFVLILFLFFLGGCATFQGAGSNLWHKDRLKEIETAYQNEAITEAEYLSLKNEADKIREERIVKENRENYSYYASYHHGYYYPYHYGYGYSHYYGHHRYGRRHGGYYGYYH